MGATSRKVKDTASTLILCALLFGAASANAEETAENKAAARELATSGIQLAQAGKCEEAIPKLVRAEKLYHAPTILTWIGQCQIKLGRFVEGTETLNRVVREKIADDAPDAYRDAQTKASELITEAQPKIGKLTIEVLPEGVEGLEVTVNERPVSTALIGAPRPTDPGKQIVTVKAPGYVTATQEVEIAEGGQETLAFSLEKAAGSAASTTESGPATSGPEAAESSSINWVGWATVGVGGALLAAGGVTGFLAMGQEKKLAEDCPDKDACDASVADPLKQARTTATLSTVFFGVGGAAAVTGIILLVTGTPSKKEKPTAGLSPEIGWGHVGVSGRF
jgi:hypothetical protein